MVRCPRRAARSTSAAGDAPTRQRAYRLQYIPRAALFARRRRILARAANANTLILRSRLESLPLSRRAPPLDAVSMAGAPRAMPPPKGERGSTPFECLAFGSRPFHVLRAFLRQSRSESVTNSITVQTGAAGYLDTRIAEARAAGSLICRRLDGLNHRHECRRDREFGEKFATRDGGREKPILFHEQSFALQLRQRVAHQFFAHLRRGCLRNIGGNCGDCVFAIALLPDQRRRLVQEMGFVARGIIENDFILNGLYDKSFASRTG